MIESSATDEPRRSRSQLRTFIGNAPFPIAMFDRELSCLAASERWVTDFGAGCPTLGGLAQALAGVLTDDHEEQWVRPDGTSRWLRWAGVPWRDDDGAIGGLVVIAEDITERKHDAEVVRDSEQRYIAVFEESPFAIALTRASDMAFVDANAAFLALFEIERSELTGKTSVELGLSNPESRDRVLAQLAASGKVRDLEVVRATKTGVPKIISINLDWVNLGGERHILTTIRDITDLKRAQETAALYEKSKELDRLKTELFANVSHELRTPLALILGPTEQMLASGTLDIATRRQVGVVHRNAQMLSRHVEDLLEVARIDAGHVRPTYGPVDVAWLTRFVAGQFQVLAAEHRVTFVLEAPAQLVAQIDRDMVQRILVNIIANAFRFTPDGGKIRITLRDHASVVHFEIADSGPGIPPPQRATVFDRFTRLAGGPRPYGGTGLGLAIVKELVGLHIGKVTIDDAPEGGALFVVELPSSPPGALANEPLPTASPDTRLDIASIVETIREPNAAPSTAPQDGQLVLVVEDNREMNAFVAACLNDAGYRVATAFDGAEGIAMATALVPDLVLTDIMMPHTSGDELVRVLRQHRKLDRTPIVVLSAKADAELRVKVLVAGAQDWLLKPFSVNELEARVGNLLARKRAEELVAALQRQAEEVTTASRAVADAVASLPEASVRAVLQTIALKARELTSAEFAAVGLGKNPEVPFNPWVYVGMEGDRAASIGRPPRALGTLGIATEHATRLRDLRTHPSHRGFPPNHPLMTSFMGVPIRYHDAPVGTLYLANKTGAPEFTDQDQRIVEMLAERVGVAIETARLYAAVGRERSWLQAVIDQMPEPIVLMDETGRISAQNRAALALASALESLGTDPYGNPVRLDLREAKGIRIAPDRSPIVRALRDRESTHALELVVRHPDGSPLPVLASATPIFTSDGELAGATMLLQDVSALKQLERLREEWASIVAHDLQQPINAIVLITDLLLRDTLDAKSRERVERVRGLSSQLGRMVGDLADASQLEAHRLTIKRERLDVCTLVREIIERVPAVSGRAALTLATSLFVDGDAGRLEQVLTNLLSNAVKYGAPETSIAIDVTASDGAAHITITNQGAGIPADELPVLFERFVRTRGAAAGTAKGTGLGLYIAKGLVEAHGGRIWAESTPGHSTTFHVAVPLAP